jgi:hypothetical protein
MRKLTIPILAVLVIGLFLVPIAFAAQGQPPIGECPPGFEIHDFHDHEMHEHDHHIGLTKDLNGNGLICVKHLSSGKHVHVDDVVQGQ